MPRLAGGNPSSRQPRISYFVMAKIPTLTAAALRQAEIHLAAADPVMAGLIERHGPCRLKPRPGDPFTILASSIIGQQLSLKAADTIEARVLAHLGGAFTPAAVLALPHETLRAAGLSNAKVRYLHALASHAESGQVDFAGLKRYPDDEIMAALLPIPGVGRWTVEMFLIFGLGRTDVLSPGDGGLQRAAAALYPRKTMEKAAEKWRPWRSVGCWYLWRSLG